MSRRFTKASAAWPETKISELQNVIHSAAATAEKYEKGVNRVGAGRLHHVARVLEAPVSFFFDGQLRPSGRSSEQVMSGFEFLTNARALRLMKAFTRIQDPRFQHIITELCERIADTQKK